MLVVMYKKATQAEIDFVVATIEERGYTARPIPGGERISIGRRPECLWLPKSWI